MMRSDVPNVVMEACAIMSIVKGEDEAVFAKMQKALKKKFKSKKGRKASSKLLRKLKERAQANMTSLEQEYAPDASRWRESLAQKDIGKNREDGSDSD